LEDLVTLYMTIQCRVCGAEISRDFRQRDTFPGRLVDSETGRQLETLLLCKACYDKQEEYSNK
jgi:hypothetical protein